MSDFVCRAEIVAALEAAVTWNFWRDGIKDAALRLRQPAEPVDGSTHWENCGRDGGPKHHECLRRDLAYAEGVIALVSKHRDAAIEDRDALRAKLKAMAEREPNEYEAMRIVDLVRAEYIVTGALKAWRYVRDALLATEATAQPAEPVDLSKVRVGGVWTCEVCGKTLPAEMAGMRCKHEPAPTPAPAEASGDVEWWGRWIQQRSGAAMLSDDDCDEFARDLRAEVARREAGLRDQLETWAERARSAEHDAKFALREYAEQIHRADDAEARVRELEAELARIREREDSYNDAFESRTGGRMLDELLESEAALKARVRELEALVDPERERLIEAVSESCPCGGDCPCDAARLSRYERARRAQSDQ